MTWLWWAPLVAAALHVTEEFIYPGGFAKWDRNYRPSIRKSITPRLHLFINAALLLACLQIGLLGKSDSAEARAIGAAAWLTIAALLFSNTLFHVIGTIRTRTRSPGVVTAIALYLPMTAAGYWHFLRTGEVALGTAVVAAIAGGSYHFWAALAHRARSRKGDA